MAEAARRGASWRLVVALGVTQIVSWGSIYYVFSLMIGAFAAAVRADRSTVVGAMAAPVLIAKAGGPILASLVLTATASPSQVLLGLAAIGAASAVLFSLTVRRRHAACVPSQRVHP